MLELRHKYKRVVAFISDLHVGSKYSVFPLDIRDENNVNVSSLMNKGQLQLLKYWTDFLERCNKLQVDTVVLVGDAIQGLNPKEKGFGLMFPDLDLQLEATCELLAPLVKNREFHVLSGTLYHGSKDVRVHKFIANELKGDFDGNIANYNLKGTEISLNVAHHASSAVVYPETPASRSMLFYKESVALGKLEPVDVIVRGHKHTFFHIHKNQMHWIQLPAWQVFVPYDRAVKNYARFQSDIGGVVLLVDDEDRIRVFHYLYPNVHISDFIRSL